MTYSETCLTILTLCALYKVEGTMKKFKILAEVLILSMVLSWIATGALNGLPK